MIKVIQKQHHQTFMQMSAISSFVPHCTQTFVVLPFPFSWIKRPIFFSSFWCSVHPLFHRACREVGVGLDFPPRPVVFLAQLSSKAFSSRTVFTGWVSTGSRQYFARLWANRGSRDRFAHGHRQSGVHRIDWGNFPIGQMEESHPFPSSSFPPVWHSNRPDRPCPE